MIPGVEFEELNAHARLFSQMGMDRVEVSPPLLSSDEVLDKVLQTIAATIIPQERKPEDAVILMGHGTHHASDAIYSALMYKAQKMDANLYVGTVEGHPTFDEVKAMLVKKGVKKAYLLPLMTVAGDHAKNDMAGEDPSSWKSQLAKEGIASVPVLQGLAEFDPLVALWVENLKTAMGRIQ
jgi:sirohydrochlorin cobaltochelatase